MAHRPSGDAISHLAGAPVSSESALRTYRKTQRWVAVVGLIVLAGSLMRFAQMAAPFANYTIHEYVAVPELGCPGTMVRVTIDRTLTRPLIGKVDSIRVYSYWEQAMTGSTPGGDTFIQPFTGNYGRHKVQSEFLRLVPDRRGPWRLVSIVTVSGTVLWKQRTTVATAQSRDIFTVLPADSPECQDD